MINLWILIKSYLLLLISCTFLQKPIMNTVFSCPLRSAFYLIVFIMVTGIACKKIDPATPVIPDPLPGSRPNIILIMGDDVGFEVPGFTGGESYATPNIDAMAEQGMQFSRCYGSPMCSPSRFMLLTGKYNFRNYGDNSWANLELDQRTVANTLQSAGYATCAAGKWQFNHGDTGLVTFGFDKYCITDPFKLASENNSPTLRLYKNPTIYENGAYRPESEMEGKYSEDIFMDYMFGFIDSSNKAKKPFFIYYAPNLCHKPFSPTPDDPEFAAWDPYKRESLFDTIFFKSMIKYYDKNMGRLLAKLKAAGIEQNTLVLFIAGDNGTDDEINSKFQGAYISGGKGHTKISGTHLAFAAYWPGHISPSKNGNLVDLVDFLPTIAAAAGVGVSPGYGPLDGISFFDQLMGSSNAEARQYSYNWYDLNQRGPDADLPVVWAMDKKYKLYSNQTSLINYAEDFLEKNPIPENEQTIDEQKETVTLQSVIDAYHN